MQEICAVSVLDFFFRLNSVCIWLEVMERD